MNTSPGAERVKKQSRVILQFGKFLNENLGKLNKYEAEFKKDVSVTNKDMVKKSITPVYNTLESNTKLTLESTRRSVTPVKTKKMDKPKPKMTLKSVPPQNYIQKELKKIETDNIKSINKDKDDIQKTNTKVNNIKNKDIKEKDSKNKKTEKIKSKVEILNKKNENPKKNIKKNSINILENKKNEVDKITNNANDKIIDILLPDEKQSCIHYVSENNNFNSQENLNSEKNFIVEKEIPVLYVSNLISSIGTKLALQEKEIEDENKKNTLISLKRSSQNYLNHLFNSVKENLKEQIKLNNEHKIIDTFINNVSTNFLNSVFKKIKENFNTEFEIEQQISNLKNEIKPEKNQTNSSIEETIISNKTINKEIHSNIVLVKMSNSDKKSQNDREKRNKNKNSNFHNNSSIENCSKIELKVNGESKKEVNERKVIERKNVNSNNQSHDTNKEKKKNILKQQQPKISIVDKKKIEEIKEKPTKKEKEKIEEIKEKPIKRDKEKYNTLQNKQVEDSKRKIKLNPQKEIKNSVKAKEINRDISSDKILKQKLDNNKSKAKGKKSSSVNQISESNIKTSENFSNILMHEDTNRDVCKETSITNDYKPFCSINIDQNKNKEENSIQSIIDKPMTKGTKRKKSINQFTLE